MSAAAARTTGNPAQRGSDVLGGFALLALMVGVVLLLIGFAKLSTSHEDPAITTCDNVTMQPGDTCTTYRNGSPIGTETYEQMYAEHVAAVEADKSQGPLFLVLGSVVGGGSVLTLIATSSSSRRRPN